MMILDFFAFGTLGFWLLITVLCFVTVISVESEKYWLPSFMTIGTIALYWKTIQANFDWREILVMVGTYVLIGMLWSVFRWFRFVRQTCNHYREEHGSVLDEFAHRALVGELKTSNHRLDITSWIAFWPFSIMGNLFGDIFRTAFETLTKVYESIARRHLSQFTRQSPAQPESQYTRR